MPRKQQGDLHPGIGSQRDPLRGPPSPSAVDQYVRGLGRTGNRQQGGFRDFLERNLNLGQLVIPLDLYCLSMHFKALHADLHDMPTR